MRHIGITARFKNDITRDILIEKAIKTYGDASFIEGITIENKIAYISTILDMVTNNYLNRCILELGGRLAYKHKQDTLESLPWYTSRPWKEWPWWKRALIQAGFPVARENPHHKGKRVSTTSAPLKMSVSEICIKLTDLCDRWDFAPACHFTPAEIDAEMLEFADRINTQSIENLAIFLKTQTSATFEHMQILINFVKTYQTKYPQLTQHLLEHLDLSGPPSLVDLLGDLKGAGASEQLIKRIDLKSASEELQISLFKALGKINDTPANIHLQLIDERDFSPAVSDAIIAARQKAKAQ